MALVREPSALPLFEHCMRQRQALRLFLTFCTIRLHLGMARTVIYEGAAYIEAYTTKFSTSFLLVFIWMRISLGF